MVVPYVFSEPVQIIFVPNDLIMVFSLPDFPRFVQSIVLDVVQIINSTSRFERINDGTQHQWRDVPALVLYGFQEVGLPFVIL